MARYTGPRVRVSRRIGFNVFENRKGDKALQDRPYPPGENGRKRARETDYGTQLKEKQKVRYMYGVLEKQFRNYYKEATRMEGITGENLLVLLESRLDNVIYRAGFAATWEPVFSARVGRELSGTAIVLRISRDRYVETWWKKKAS